MEVLVDFLSISAISVMTGAVSLFIVVNGTSEKEDRISEIKISPRHMSFMS